MKHLDHSRCSCSDCFQSYGPRPAEPRQEFLLYIHWARGALRKEPRNLTYHEAKALLHELADRKRST